jgi:hypothetical protein
MRSLYKNEGRLGEIIFISWLGVAVFSGLFVRQVNANRANIIFYPLIILTALGINTVLQSVSHHKKSITLAITAAYAVSFFLFSRTYFGSHNERLSQIFYSGFHQSVVYAEGIKSERNLERLYITDYTQFKGSAQVSEILTLFSAAVDPMLYRNRVRFYEQYRIVSFDNKTQENTLPSALYVFNFHERHLFPADLYEIVWFDGYGVAERKN